MKIKYISTIAYIAAIVFINVGFVYAPPLHIGNQMIPLFDIVTGSVLILRDFSQRELGHYVLIAMVVAGLLSYSFASQAIAVASMTAFLFSETFDWLIFTFTRKPLSDRLLWSSGVSAPIDSVIFLGMIHRLTLLNFILMTLSKFIGIFVLWFLWRQRHRKSKNPLILENLV